MSSLITEESVRLPELKRWFPSVVMDEIFGFLIPNTISNLNDNTEDVSVCVNDDKITDINTLLIGLCLRCPKLENLNINVSYENYDSSGKYDVKTIDFARLYMPHLNSLSLQGIGLADFRFSERNMPNLKSIHLEEIADDIEAWKVTGLDKLESLTITHTFITDSDGFQDFINSSPSLQEFTSYKCRGLDKQIWRLPSAETIELYRAECLESLVILYAPKLTSLSVRAAYSCEHIRVFNCPNLSSETLKSFLKDLSDQDRGIIGVIQEELKKWQLGEYGKKELIERNIIDKWETGNDFKTNETIQECVKEGLSEDADSMMQENYQEMMGKMQAYHDAKGMASQPKIKVNCTNMTVDYMTAAHLQSHSRIGSSRIIGAQDDGWGLQDPFSAFMFGM